MSWKCELSFAFGLCLMWAKVFELAGMVMNYVTLHHILQDVKQRTRV